MGVLPRVPPTLVCVSNLDDWRELAAKELKGTDPDTLVWETPEGIAIKPLYTGADLEGVEFVDSLPGLAPFVTLTTT